MWTVILPLLFFSFISFGLLWYRLYKSENHWGEFIPRLLIFGIAPFVISLIVYGVGFHSRKTFKEYWHNMYVEVSHIDSWNEKVSCRHPHYVTVPDVSTYRDSDGHTHTRTGTKRVQRGHEHSYDVDEHPECWMGLLDNGDETGISQSEYQHYSMLWENSTNVDMNRHYYSKDGDKQVSSWNNLSSTAFAITTIHSYENRVRASGAFDNDAIPDDLKETFKHPIESGSMEAVFVYGLPMDTMQENDLLKTVNGLLGYKREIHIMLFVINAQKYNQEVVKVINQIWEGPNKNELAVFVGINENKDIVWCDVLSWSVNKELHSKIIEMVTGVGIYDGVEIVDGIAKLVPVYWQRRHFADFKKMAVSTPRYVYITAAMLFILFHGVMWGTITVWTFVKSKQKGYLSSRFNGFGGLKYEDENETVYGSGKTHKRWY